MGDLIDREQVYDILEDAYDTMKHQGFSAIASVIKATGEQIINLPAVEARPKARWIEYPHGSGCYCSNCKLRVRYKDKKRFLFCPHCGAEMDGVE